MGAGEGVGDLDLDLEERLERGTLVEVITDGVDDDSRCDDLKKSSNLPFIRPTALTASTSPPSSSRPNNR